MSRDRIVKQYRIIGLFPIIGMLLVNIMLATTVFFGMETYFARESFLALAVMMTLILAVAFPTKMMPNSFILLKAVALMVIPHILANVMVREGRGTLPVIMYALALLISFVLCYFSIMLHLKSVRYIATENYNDYAIFEYSTFKIAEINVYTLAFLFINFFIAMSREGDVLLTIIIAVNIVIALILNYLRTVRCKNDKIKISYYLLESVSTIAAFVVIMLVGFLELNKLLYILSFALMIPTVVMAVTVFRSIDSFMYK